MQSGIDGDVAGKPPEELTTTTPSGLVLKALDTNGDGDPDQFTLEGKFEIEVTESDSHDLKLNKDPADSLSVTATAPNKNTSQAASLPLVEDTANPVEPEFPNDNQAPEVPTVTANPNDGSVKVKLPTDAVAGDKVTVSLTPTGKDASVEVVLTKNPDGSWTSSNSALVPDAIDDQAFVTIPESAVKDGSKVSAKATDLAGNESKTSSDNAGNDRRTNTPVDLKAKAIDLDEKANGSAEKLVITGKVPGEQAGTKVFLFDAKGTQIGETTTGADGSFSFTVVKNNQPAEQHQGAVFVPAVNEDDSYRVQAKAEDKLPSLNKPEVTVPAVPVFGDKKEDGTAYTKDELAEFHPNDKADPTAPTVTAGQPDKVKGDGSASIGLPADAVEGDKVMVTFTPEDKDGQAQPEQTLEVTKQPDGSWKITAPEEALEPAPSINGNVLTLPENLLKDGEPVKAKSQDNMGKESAESEATTGKDEVATTPTAVKFTPIGEGETADLDPEGVKITGKGKPGETIEVLDNDGSPINGADGAPIKRTIPANAQTDENGLAEFTIDVKEPNPATIDEGTELKLKATHRDKEESDTVSQTVPAMQPADAKKDWDDQDIPNAGEGNHTGDSTAPAAPELLANSDKGNGSVKLSKPAEPTQAGDRIEVKLIPETAENDEPVIVTLTKQPDGSWESSDNALVPSIPAGEESVDIPENSLKDGREVKARTVDVAGNVSTPIKTATAGNDDITKTPYDLVAKPFDTSSPADTQADAVLIQGKTDPNAEVTVMKNGVELFKVTADAQGNFSVLAKNENATDVDKLKTKLAEKGITADIKDVATGQSLNGADELTFKAKHQAKDESDTANATVGELTNGKDQHPFDETAPQAPQVTAIETGDITGKELGSVEITLPSTTAQGEAPQNGDKVEIRYTKTTGEQATLVVTRENDAWTLPDNTLATEATIDGDTVTLSAPAVKDGSTVYAQTIDVAGNPSALASAKAAFEQTTELSDVTLRASKADPTKPATDTNPEVLTVTGTTEPGAQVSVALVTAKGSNGTPDTVKTLTTTADNNGNFSVTFAEGTYPLTNGDEVVAGHNVIVTAELVGKKAPSAPDTQQVPSTRTMFIEKGETDVVDKGTLTGNAYNANLSDNTIDEVTFTGKVEKGAKLKVQVLAANGDVIAEKEFDNADIGYDNEVLSTAQGAKLNSSNDPVDSGDFRVKLTKADLKQGKQFEKGQTVKITASHPTDTSIGENTVDGTALPALVDGTADHPDDNQATALTETAISFSHSSNTAADDGKTHASIQMPTEADVNKVTVTFNDESGTSKTAVFTRKTGGGWAVSTKNGENTAGLSDITGNTLTIAHDKLNGGTDANQRGSISVTVEDIAGQSKTLTQAVPEDKTTALSVTNTTGADTSPRADKVAETVTITGTATDGATVTLVDANGTPIVKTGGGNITATATGGNFSLTYNVADIPEDKRAGAKLVAKAAGHQTSAQTSFTVPEATTHTEKNKPAVTAAVEDTTSAVRFTMQAVQDNDSDSDKLPKLADGDVLKVFKGDGATVIAEFKYDNGAWTPVGTKNANVDAPVAIKDSTGKTTGWYVDVRADNADFPQGTTIKAKLTDIAGNFGEADGNLPNPDHIDIPEVFVGSRKNTHPNDDVKDAERLEIPANNEPSIDPNAGDIWIKPGADNTKIAITFVKENATIDPKTGEFSTTTIFGVKTANSWVLAEDENGDTPVDYGSVKSIGGTPHLQINASAVRDKSDVSVVANDGVNTTSAMKVAGQNQPVDNTKYITTDFDDNSEGVTVKAATQTGEKITITPAENDAIMHITEFETSTYFDGAVAARYDLAGSGKKNYLVAYKVPKEGAAGNEWKLGLISASEQDFNTPEKFSEFAAAAARFSTPHPDVATIDPQTGVVTLNAVMVRDQSTVKVGYVDAYGETGITGADGQPKSLVVSNNNRTEPVYVDAPEVEPLGNGLVQVTAGQVDIKPGATPDQDTLDGSNFKTLIDLTGDLDKDAARGAEITIVYDDATKAYKLDNGHTVGSTVNNVTITAFDPTSGTVTLKSTQDGAPVKAVAYKTPEGQTQPKPSAVVESSFSVADPFKEEADQPTVKADLYGAMEIIPGADNKKVEVSYTDENGQKQTATLTLDSGTWTSDKPNDFEITSGKIKLKNDKVKDGTEVSAVGFDGNDYPDDYPDTALRGQPVKSEPHSDYALVNDDPLSDSAIAPNIVKDTQDGNADKDVLITRGGDNSRMDITFTPKGKNIANEGDKMTIVAKLEKGGEWSLTHEDGTPVDASIAVMRSPGVVELKNAAIAPTKGTADTEKSKVTAVGYDNAGHSAPSNTYELPVDPNSSSTSVSPGNTNYQSWLKIEGDGQFEGWTNMEDANRFQMMFYAFDKEDETLERYILRYENGTETILKFPAGQSPAAISGTFADFGATYERGSGSTSHKIKVDSNKAKRFWVVTDSPREGDVATHNPYGKVAYSATADRSGNAESYVAQGDLPNKHKHDYKPFDPAPAVELVVPDTKDVDNQGGMRITPHADHTRLQVKYVRESGGKATALLEKNDQGKWIYNNKEDYPNDFILDDQGFVKVEDDGSIRMHFDAVKDQSTVSVRGGQSGKRYSEAKDGVSHDDAAPTQPADSGLREELNNALTSPSLTLNDDVEVRNGTIRKGKESKGFTALKDYVLSDGGSVVIDKTTVVRNVKMEFNKSKGHAVLVEGSLGDTLAKGWGAFKGKIYDMNVDMTDHDDILALQNDLGENDTQGQLTRLNMGGGHDVLTVGGATSDFVLVEDTTSRDPKTRYRFENIYSNLRVSEAKDIEIQGLENNSLGSSVGGRMHHSIVNMGDGNDLVIVEGFRSGDPFAIDHSAVHLGNGNDVLLVAPNGEDNRTFSDRGSIGNSIIDAGNGDDYINAVGADSGAKIYLGNGNDTLVLTRVERDSTLIDAGSGDDVVNVTGEVRGGAKINLGSGDDVFIFGGNKNILFGRSGTHALFEGELDGGSGYDIVKLATPHRTSLINQQQTNLFSKNFKNIEEIWLANDTSVDLRYADLLADGVSGPIKIRALDPNGNPLTARAIVDLGANDLNGTVNGNLVNGGTSEDSSSNNGTWRKVGTETEFGVTYNVFHFNGDSSTAVWVENHHHIVVI